MALGKGKKMEREGTKRKDKEEVRHRKPVRKKSEKSGFFIFYSEVGSASFSAFPLFLVLLLAVVTALMM